MSGLPLPASNWFVLGSESEPPPPLPLRSGSLRLLFEPGSGFLRRVCLGEQEILRGIYAAVRDRNWTSVPGALRETRREVTPESFCIEFDSEHRQGELHFVWHGRVCGEPHGRIRYEFDGEARSTFLRNRIGLCVLHPIHGCSGRAARQRRIDGSVIDGEFPKCIAPQIFGQSEFHDLRGVAHEVVPGLWAELEFEGEVFEMEDQRNWTDASFKTYGTPLALPFPAEIRTGTRVRQTVTLQLAGDMSRILAQPIEITEPKPQAVTVALREGPGAPLPRLGLRLASHGGALSSGELARLRDLRLGHLRVDVRLSAPDWPAVWDRASQEAGQLGIGLELAVHLLPERDGGLGKLRRRLEARPCTLARVLALRENEPVTGPQSIAQVRRALSGIDVPIGAGSDANYCELNRGQALGQVALAEADFLFWSINPQVHAFDSVSIVETLEAQVDTVKTARMFAKGKPLVISPVSLKPRFNAVATTAPGPNLPGDLPKSVDPRQLSSFAAAWTLGSIEGLSNAGTQSITLFETTGWLGVMEKEIGSPLPAKFPSFPGSVFPIYHVLDHLAGAEQISPTTVSAPLRLAAMAVLDKEGRSRFLVGNLTAQPQRLHLVARAPAAMVRMLAEDQILLAMREPEKFRAREAWRLVAHHGILELNLAPHALACLETVHSIH